MRRGFVLFCIIIALTINAYATTYDSPRDPYKEASAVFIGKAVEGTGERRDGNATDKAKFKVEKVYKGKVPDQVEVSMQNGWILLGKHYIIHTRGYRGKFYTAPYFGTSKLIENEKGESDTSLYDTMYSSYLGERNFFDRASAADPENIDLQRLRASYLIEQQDYELAADTLRALLKRQPNDLRAANMLIPILYKMDDARAILDTYANSKEHPFEFLDYKSTLFDNQQLKHYYDYALVATGDYLKYRPDRWEFKEIDIDNKDMSNGDFSRAKFDEMRASFLTVEKADFTYANFWQTQIHVIKGKHADFSHSQLDMAYLNHADMAYADFSHASIKRGGLGGKFKHADFSHADISRTSLQFTDFTGANLSHAKLWDVNLANCNLTDANLKDIQFHLVEYSCHTQWPEGFKVTDHPGLVETFEVYPSCPQPAQQ